LLILFSFLALTVGLRALPPSLTPFDAGRIAITAAMQNLQVLQK
jgi:hypothetical protein